MNHDLNIKNSITIHTSPDNVWDALVNPEKIKLYLYGTETISDWKEGSKIIFQGEYEGHKYKDHGIIQKIVPNKYLEYTYWTGFSGLEDTPENHSLFRYSVELKEISTELTIEQIGFANEEQQTHTEVSWERLLEEIKKLAES